MSAYAILAAADLREGGGRVIEYGASLARGVASHFGLCSVWRRPPGGGRPALHRAARRAAPARARRAHRGMCREDAPDGAHGRAGRPPSLPIESGPGRQIDAVAGCERPCATSAPQEPLPFGNASCPSPGRPVTLSAFGQLAPSEVRQAARQIQSETLPGVFHGLDVERRAARRRLRRARRTARSDGRLNEEPSGCGSRAGAHDGVNAPDYTPPPGARQARDTDLSGGGSADG